MSLTLYLIDSHRSNQGSLNMWEGITDVEFNFFNIFSGELDVFNYSCILRVQRWGHLLTKYILIYIFGLLFGPHIMQMFFVFPARVKLFTITFFQQKTGLRSVFLHILQQQNIFNKRNTKHFLTIPSLVARRPQLYARKICESIELYLWVPKQEEMTTERMT